VTQEKKQGGVSRIHANIAVWYVCFIKNRRKDTFSHGSSGDIRTSTVGGRKEKRARRKKN